MPITVLGAAASAHVDIHKALFVGMKPCWVSLGVFLVRAAKQTDKMKPTRE